MTRPANNPTAAPPAVPETTDQLPSRHIQGAESKRPARMRMTIRLKFRSLAVALLIFQCFSVNADILPKRPSLPSLDMEHFRDTATVKDDPSDSTTTITTEKGYVDQQGLLRTVWNDEYLKGVIDKKTGQKTFQVEAWMTYQGRWRTYQTASYQGSSGPKSVPAIQLSK